MGSDAPIPPYMDRVQLGWLDRNDDMGEAYYALIFARATDAFLEAIGLDAITRERNRSSVYGVEAHICYLSRVGEGEPLQVTTQVLDFDDTQAHVFHEMRHGKSGTLLATEELMLLHVAGAGPGAAPFPAEVSELLSGLQEAQAHLLVPEQAGRVIGIGR